eukprot:TRINITY_DN7112_c0_g1_i1.p1 TRINITY_DN7112_c0_g1~~TRINITY_DN7112_c0_g1_i1.p1  ORF type:complete len:957 (+),score=273.78 TRINITY_DN7112_c0_g1_i1:97-2967(+)
MASSGEKNEYAGRSACYKFDKTTKTWRSLEQGLCRLFIYHHPNLGRYRCIAYSDISKTFVLNVAIFRRLAPNRCSETFVAWADPSGVFGLAFVNGEECKEFIAKMQASIQHLGGKGLGLSLPAADAASPADPETPTTSRSRKGTTKKGHSENEGSSKSRTLKKQGKGNQPLPSKLNASQPGDEEAGPGYGPNSLVTKPVKELNDRMMVMREIFLSEKSYVKTLNTLVDECISETEPGGRFAKTFNDSETRIIFGNASTIRKLNVGFLGDLGRRLDEWTEDITIGDVFLGVIPYFKMYKEYFSNYDAAMAEIERASKRKEVREFLKFCESKAEGHKLPYLLIGPVQRVPRYGLLLRELIKKTDESHPDYGQLAEAHLKINAFTSQVNEGVRMTENMNKLARLINDPKKFGGFEDIVQPHRHLIFDADVNISVGENKYTWMLLFDDIIVFASETKGKKTKEMSLYLMNVWFDDLSKIGSAPYVFEVKSPEYSFKVNTKGSKGSKQLWLENGNKALSNIFPNQDQARSFIYSFKDKRQYKGQWRDGVFDGVGHLKYPKGGRYEGDFVCGRREGSGNIMFKSGDTYDGEWKDDLPNGEGTLTIGKVVYTGKVSAGKKEGPGKLEWPNGDIYEGEFKDDFMDGEGTLTFNDGAGSYVGQFRLDRFHGHGTLTYLLGVYDGEFNMDIKEGAGKMTYLNGDEYTGTWKADLRHGTGTFCSKGGDIKYEGEWNQGRYQGKGKLELKDTSVYEGSFKDGRCWGAGVKVYQNGSKYDGSWADDRYEGTGTLTSVNGDHYEGNWHTGKRFGRGVSTTGDGTYEGEWLKDRKEGKGVFTWPDGSKYSGGFMSDKRHGRGVFTSADESAKYAGQWVNDEKHGEGSLTDPCGVFEGMWEHDRRHGTGTFKDPNGNFYEGTWANDRFAGSGKLQVDTKTIFQILTKGSSYEKPGWARAAPPVQPCRSLMKN